MKILQILKTVQKGFKKIRRLVLQDHNCVCQANLYETSIHPMLRFLHEKNIQSCGWVTLKIPNENFIKDNDSKEFNVDIEIRKLSELY